MVHPLPTTGEFRISEASGEGAMVHRRHIALVIDKNPLIRRPLIRKEYACVNTRPQHARKGITVCLCGCQESNGI